jgi:hypothetical protein
VEYDKSEENYIRAKSFMESLAYTSEQNKQSVLDRLEKTYLNKTLINKFYSIKTLVFDSIELICEGDVVRDGFLDTSKKFWEEELSLERVKELEDETNKVCSVINKYIDDPLTSFVENEIKGKWPNDRLMENKLVLQHSALARSSIAFRIGGVELAQEVCDYISDTVIEIKEWCKKNVYIINNIEKCMVSTGEKFEECVAKEKETCGEYKKSIANSICVET